MAQSMTTTFSFEEMNLILRGLGELPAKESIDLIQKIHSEWNKLQIQNREQETSKSKRLQEKPKLVESSDS